MFRFTWSGRVAPWAWAAAAVLLSAAVARWVDLAPRVETDFFFSEDDRQLQASLELDRRFPSPEQVIIRTEDLEGDESAYRDRLAMLTEELLALDEVRGAYSVTNQSAAGSPLFRRILLNPDSGSTNIVLQTEPVDPAQLLPSLEVVLDRHRGAELAVVMSGVPVIVERIRQSLFRDLVVFSSVAVGLFTLIILLVYRDPGVLLGTLVTATTTVSATLLATRVLGISIGLLTANIITIVFVLTLSHVVFLTGNWSRVARASGNGVEATRRAVADTLEGSFWSMTTTLFGFLSLLLASAKPLRELGLAGAIGTATALLVTYAAYPALLAHRARVRPIRSWLGPAMVRGSSVARPVLGTVVLLVVAVGFGVPRLDTDPGLLTYFAPGSSIREGLEQIDRDGGSSILKIAVTDPEGRRIDSAPAIESMDAFQTALEADSAVGVVLSPSVLIGHARTQPLARFLTPAILLDIAESPELDQVALSYVTPDRDQGLFFLRMRETVEEPSRRAVMDRIAAYAADSGLETVLVGGLYDLQDQLGRLIAASLRIGLGGLLTLFLLIAWVVSRSVRTTAAMFACLVGIPLVVLGVFGWTGTAVDIITSPAANVALAMGVDSMIHLVVRVRRIHRRGSDAASAWMEGQRQIGPPVIAATLIICAGFGIFALSSFPPTRRFGFAVILGTMTAATMALLTLPSVASLWTGAQEAEPEPAQ
jgi:predicted RND superfamily exporter protein